MTYSFRTNGNFIDFVHTDNTSLQVESVLRSLHNTSRAVTWSLPEDETRINFTVDDIRVEGFPIAEIDFDGTAINSQDDFETGIEAAFPGLAGGGEGAASYLVYTALLTQTGTNAPVATVLENTLGGTVVWSRNDVGDYAGVLAGVFTQNKTWVSCVTNGATGAIICVSAAVSEDGISVFNYSDAAYTLTDSMTAYIEIRVYP